LWRGKVDKGLNLSARARPLELAHGFPAVNIPPTWNGISHVFDHRGEGFPPKPDSIAGKLSVWKAAVSIIAPMSLDFAECDRARLARDPAYDGRFYTGVYTTGIYCRPVCPVRPAPVCQCFLFSIGGRSGRRRFSHVPALPARNCSVLQRMDR
jgi:hypothetical protein